MREFVLRLRNFEQLSHMKDLDVHDIPLPFYFHFNWYTEDA